MAKKAAGRPKGSKTKDRPVAYEEIAQCPHCGSCNRGQFGSVERRVGDGTFKGRQYSAIELRRCLCRDCGGAMTVFRHIWV